MGREGQNGKVVRSAVIKKKCISNSAPLSSPRLHYHNPRSIDVYCTKAATSIPPPPKRFLLTGSEAKRRGFFIFFEEVLVSKQHQ
jgi:hypothetical protein